MRLRQVRLDHTFLMAVPIKKNHIRTPKSASLSLRYEQANYMQFGTQIPYFNMVYIKLIILVQFPHNIYSYALNTGANSKYKLSSSLTLKM